MAAAGAVDFYAELGVGRAASEKDIKAAYRKLAKQYHPDLNKDDAESEAKFKTISEAYGVLSDKVERRSYDLSNPWAGGGSAGRRGGGHAAPFGGANSASDDARIREWAAQMGFDVKSTRAEFYKQYNQRPEASEQFDFDEWNRMHFGPSAAQREEAIYERYKESQQAEAENIRKEARWKRYGVAFADRGPMERDYYRQRAEVHRAGRAARRAWWPLQLALFAGMGVAIWKGFDLLEPQVQERHSGRGR